MLDQLPDHLVGDGASRQSLQECARALQNILAAKIASDSKLATTCHGRTPQCAAAQAFVTVRIAPPTASIDSACALLSRLIDRSTSSMIRSIAAISTGCSSRNA